MSEHLLERILAALEKIAGVASDGFIEPSRNKTYLYANTTSGDRWYTLDDDMQPVLAPTAAIKGTVTGVEVVEVERRNKATRKLRTTLETKTAGVIVIESGFDTQFTKGLLSGLLAVGKHGISNPITIQCNQSKQDDKILFCQLFDASGFVKAHYDSETDFEGVLGGVLNLFNGGSVAQQAAQATPSVVPNRDALIARSTQLMKQAGVSVDEAREKLKERYDGKQSRQELTDEELGSFVGYLEVLAAAVGQEPRIPGESVNNKSVE